MSGPAGQAAEPQVTVRTTRYTVSALPDGFEEAWRWDLTVTRQRDGRWVIEHDGMFLTPDQQWSESRVDAARITGRGVALDIAKQHAPNVIGAAGLTPADAVARSKEQ